MTESDGDVVEGIEQLGLTYLRTEGFACDLCDAKPIIYDREWLGPGKWELYLKCPDCDRETTMETRSAYLHMDISRWEDRLKRKYTETEMSEKALERSLDRLYGSGQ